MEKQTKINFILPFKPRRPAGGFRVMYEYANRLAQKGYSVHLTFPIKTPYMKYRLPYIVRLILSKLEGFNRNKWFKFDLSITMSYVPSVKDKYIENSDIVISTWWATVLEMGSLSPEKGKKINLIQGFENWEGHEDKLYNSYNLKDTTNIVVASYLEEIVRKHTNNKIELIENGIDSNVFQVKNPIDNRKAGSIAMMYSSQRIKGSKYGLEALAIVKEKYPELEVQMFGISQAPSGLPTWIKYHRDPNNLQDIYNSCAIFISNSLTEGFGLVSVESMFCGCALICTNIDGHKEYAADGETALLTNTGDSLEMANKISFLIDNSIYRKNLAKKGNEYVQRFSWDNAIEKIEYIIKNI